MSDEGLHPFVMAMSDSADTGSALLAQISSVELNEPSFSVNKALNESVH